MSNPNPITPDANSALSFARKVGSIMNTYKKATAHNPITPAELAEWRKACDEQAPGSWVGSCGFNLLARTALPRCLDEIERLRGEVAAGEVCAEHNVALAQEESSKLDAKDKRIADLEAEVASLEESLESEVAIRTDESIERNRLAHAVSELRTAFDTLMSTQAESVRTVAELRAENARLTGA